MHRVLIIGSPGAGKSTLSRALATRTGLPLYHMDRLHWLPGWIERDRDEAFGEVRKVLAQDRWIIDGNYGSTLPERVKRADTVVWLDYPTAQCLWRVFRRRWQYRGTNRPDMTEGCNENINWEFLHFVTTFRRSWHGRNGRALRDFAGVVIKLRSQRETDEWLASLAARAVLA
ncbi:AAA family ATPase [Novosphingobium sp.]|uniref:AAA family ATPase n=1 Tax=Novosphingobium sp. TaxID=1874826 RepID=UPI00286E60DE|nr:AAA family ATPase [Novosphingobium sp.]